MLPDADDTLKQTNEIGMAIPLLDTLAIDAKTITADALLTQRKLAASLRERNAQCAREGVSSAR
jgi:predicted transposase YbfD/YdcC